jgi:hypothetical protein
MAPTSWPAGGRVGSTLWPGSSSTMSPPPRSARSTPRGVDDADAPIMDGAIEPIWDRAPALAFATNWKGDVTPHRSTVRLLWSARGLHVLWQVEGTKGNTDQRRPIDVERDGLYQEDCVELFIAPDPAVPRRYFEIEVGPFGHWFDIAVDRSGRPGAVKQDTAWSGAPHDRHRARRRRRHRDDRVHDRRARAGGSAAPRRAPAARPRSHGGQGAAAVPDGVPRAHRQAQLPRPDRLRGAGRRPVGAPTARVVGCAPCQVVLVRRAASLVDRGHARRGRARRGRGPPEAGSRAGAARAGWSAPRPVDAAGAGRDLHRRRSRARRTAGVTL